MPAGQMEIIVPITITDAILTSSTIAENDATAWNSGTAYVVGNVAMITTNVHKIFICMVDNTNKTPATAANIYNPDADPVTGYWSLVSATNRWKMFDKQTGSASTNAASIVTVLTPGQIYNSLAMFRLVCDTVNVTVDRGVDEIYNVDVDMKDLTDIDGYYDWFFSPIAKKDTVILTDLPAYTDTVMTITVNAASGTRQIGEMVIGRVRGIGVCEYGSTLGILDFSRKETDEDGLTTIEERRFANTIDYGITMRSNRVNQVKRLLATYRATPIVYIGDEGLPETIVYGFFNDFSIVLDNYNISSCSLQVEELS